jgi:hypothetical protein
MKTYTLWLLRSNAPRDAHLSWFPLRSRTLTFERLNSNYPNHDIQWVCIQVPEED